MKKTKKRPRISVPLVFRMKKIFSNAPIYLFMHLFSANPYNIIKNETSPKTNDALLGPKPCIARFLQLRGARYVKLQQNNQKQSVMGLSLHLAITRLFHQTSRSASPQIPLDRLRWLPRASQLDNGSPTWLGFRAQKHCQYSSTFRH